MTSPCCSAKSQVRKVRAAVLVLKCSSCGELWEKKREVTSSAGQ